jgi:hypothetical protein
LVLAEASWVLSTVFSRTASQIAEAIAQLLEHESLVVQDPDVVALALPPLAEEACSRALGLFNPRDRAQSWERAAGNVPLETFDAISGGA